jgi:hypothetical protein
MMKLKSKVKFGAYSFSHYAYIVHITGDPLANYMLSYRSTVYHLQICENFTHIILQAI